jgi:hypothetical protein
LVITNRAWGTLRRNLTAAGWWRSFRMASASRAPVSTSSLVGVCRPSIEIAIVVRRFIIWTVRNAADQAIRRIIADGDGVRLAGPSQIDGDRLTNH